MKHVHFRRQVKTERAKQAIHQKRQILIQQISVSFLKCQNCLKTLNWARSGDKKMWLKSYYNITSTRLETFEEVCNLYELNLIQNLFGYRVRLQDRARNLATLLRLGTPRDKGEICSHCHFTQHLQRLISFQIESTFTTEFLIKEGRHFIITMLIVCRLRCNRLYTYMIYLTCILNDFFECSKQQRPFISFFLQLLQSIPHRIVWFKNPWLILDMKVNGIEMLFSRFSDKDCMKISIKCLKKFLSLIQSGYSNFVHTEGF